MTRAPFVFGSRQGLQIADTVFVATTKSAKRVHIERDWSTTWCGAKVHVRTGPPSPPTYLCPKCKSEHAAAFGLPNLSRRAKR